MDSRLLDILVCPATKGKLVLKRIEKTTENASENTSDEVVEKVIELWSRSAGLAYLVTDGIPCMVESEARTLSNDEIASIKNESA